MHDTNQEVEQEVVQDSFESMSDEEFMSQEWDYSMEETTAEDAVESTDEEDTEESYEDTDSDDDDDEDEAEPSEQNETGDLSQLIGVPIQTAAGEIILNSTDEVLRLVKMGADSFSGQANKDEQRTLKLLKSNNLLDQDKLGMVIDIMQGNPNALRKLIQEREIDIDLLDSDEPIDYTPSKYEVSDSQLELDSVVKELSSRPEGAKAINIIANEWDDESRRAILAQPNNIRHIADHIKDGSYEKITSEITRRKLLGTIPTQMGFIQAYATVGEALFGGGSEPVDSVKQKTTQAPAERKRVAKTRKSSNRRTEPSDSELANLTDEEFLKRFGN